MAQLWPYSAQYMVATKDLSVRIALPRIEFSVVADQLRVDPLLGLATYDAFLPMLVSKYDIVYVVIASHVDLCRSSSLSFVVF